ncbi:MAG: hypothetical protein HRF50_09385 [Phycisphaerae bacterium]|jgi:hypothetical protein
MSHRKIAIVTVGLGALVILAAAQSWTAVAGPAPTTPPPAIAPDPADVERFVGHSASGDFQEALNDALMQADQYFANIGADILYNYRVLSTTGRRGGFAGFNDLYVTIAASGDGS